MIAVGTITATDVPLATTGSMPRSTIIAGTMITPPPIPSSPASVPVSRPTATRSTAIATVRSLRPVESVLITRRVAVANTVITKTTMSTFFGMICSSVVPTMAPAIAPIARKNATAQSTLPCDT